MVASFVIVLFLLHLVRGPYLLFNLYVIKKIAGSKLYMNII